MNVFRQTLLSLASNFSNIIPLLTQIMFDVEAAIVEQNIIRTKSMSQIKSD
jgi:hypothetical protein